MQTMVNCVNLKAHTTHEVIMSDYTTHPGSPFYIEPPEQPYVDLDFIITVQDVMNVVDNMVDKGWYEGLSLTEIIDNGGFDWEEMLVAISTKVMTTNGEEIIESFGDTWSDGQGTQSDIDFLGTIIEYYSPPKYWDSILFGSKWEHVGHFAVSFTMEKEKK